MMKEDSSRASPTLDLGIEQPSTTFFETTTTTTLDKATLPGSSQTAVLLNEDQNSNENTKNDDNNERKATPLPIGSMIAVLMVSLVEGFAYTFIFPFIGFMILDFGLVKESKDAGYYAGILAGSFSIAEFFTGFFYGWIADKVSKRYVVMASTVGCGITIIMFGFSRNFAFAVATRALNGALSGSIATTKAYLSEITDSSNQALSFSLLTVGWGVGAIGGPAIGGFLSSPATKYPSSFGKIALLKSFPYLLPCLFAACLMVLNIVIVGIFMTDPKKKIPQMNNDDGEDDLEMQDITESTDVSQLDQPDLEIPENETQLEERIVQKEVFLKRIYRKMSYEVRDILSSVWSKDVMISMLLYFLCIVVEVFQDELLPLWSMIETNKGGLSFNTNQIGIVQSIFGGLYLVLPILYPPISKRLGHLTSLRIGFLLIIPLLFTPQLAQLARISKALLWTGFVFYSILRAITGTLTFTAAVIMISNAAPEGSEGKVQGFSNSFGSMGRTVAPFMAGPMLAVSADMVTKLSTWSINAPFAFFALLSLGAFGLSLVLTKSIDKPKAERSS